RCLPAHGGCPARGAIAVRARPPRFAALACAALALAVACTHPSAPPARHVARPGPIVTPVAPAAANPLCRHPKPPPRPTPSATSLPPAVTAVEHQVEQVRRLAFLHPVTPESVSQSRIGQLLQQ